MAETHDYHIVFLPDFFSDLDRIEDFYRSKDEELAARVLALILDGAYNIGPRPFSFPQLNLPTYYHLREAYVPLGKHGFMIRFEIDEERREVLIYRVHHTREDRFNELS